VRALRANPQVVFNFNSTPSGGDVVVVQGTATLVNEGEVSPTSAAFAEKYAGGLAGLGLTAETFVADYSQLIRIAPTRLRGF
jgi:PPOX class probable F420-dependent enzyme